MWDQRSRWLSRVLVGSDSSAMHHERSWLFERRSSIPYHLVSSVGEEAQEWVWSRVLFNCFFRIGCPRGTDSSIPQLGPDINFLGIYRRGNYYLLMDHFDSLRVVLGVPHEIWCIAPLTVNLRWLYIGASTISLCCGAKVIFTSKASMLEAGRRSNCRRICESISFHSVSRL